MPTDKPSGPPKWDRQQLAGLVSQRMMELLNTKPRELLFKQGAESALLRYVDRAYNIPDGEKDTPVSWDSIQKLLGRESVERIKSD